MEEAEEGESFSDPLALVVTAGVEAEVEEPVSEMALRVCHLKRQQLGGRMGAGEGQEVAEGEEV